MSWTYQGKPPEDLWNYLGFVYLITSPTGMKYVGKKQLWKKVRRKPLKGQKRVRIGIVESDWKTYYGSSNELKAELKRTGPEGWTREILHLCTTKWDMAWYELKEQLARNVLTDPTYYNGIIHVRLSVKKTFTSSCTENHTK